MVGLRSTEWIAAMYAGGIDPPFSSVLSRVGPVTSDEELAELIEMDGRARIDAGHRVDLERYLGAVEGLEGRPVSLDAAIDVSLRSLSPDGGRSGAAVAELSRRYPNLAVAIRDAAMLGEAMWSTSTLRSRAAPSISALPGDVGPVSRSGEARYQIQRLLGSGGWGAVYLAADRQLSEPDKPALVAVKLFESAAADPWVRRRLAEEATKARRVLHDNVVRVLDLGVSDRGQDYIVYEYIDGGDLRCWAEGRTFPLDQREASRLMARVARGVQAAHGAGLVHCDLKPGNILVTSGGEPKVADFGIAVRAGEQEQPWDRGDSGRPAGNLAFISPEQYRMEEGCLCIPSDIYALGGILYYLLTGWLPNGQSADEIARVHDREGGRRVAPGPREAIATIDRDLDAITRKAMAVTPQERHSSAGALADDLEAFLRYEPLRWTRPSPARVATLWVRRRPAVAATSLGIVLSVLGGTSAGTYWWFEASQRAQETQREKAKIEAGKAAAGKGIKYLSLMKKENLSDHILASTMALEWLNGPAFLGQPGDHTVMWQERQAVVRMHLDDAKRNGRGESVDALIYQKILGFWLLDDKKAGEAEAVLNDTLRSWRTLAPSDGPGARELELLIAAAGVRRLGGVAKDGGLDAEQKAELRSLASVLETEKDHFTGRIAGGPAHKLILTVMGEMYGRTLLNQSPERKRVLKRLETFAD